MHLIEKTIYIVEHDAQDKAQYVVHRELVGPYGGREVTRNFITNRSLHDIRKQMREWKLYCIERAMGDHPRIVEKWV